MNNMIKIDLIDDTSKIDVELTDYNDKEVRDDIEELRQTKVDKIQGKGLSTNDYTDNEKNKLANLENYDDTEVRRLINTKQPRGNYLIQETDPTVPSYIKNITQNNISSWNNKQEQLISGTNIKTINNTSLLGNGNLEIEGVTNYSELSNKPQINNVTLSGNKSLNDLGIQPAGNYITKAVNDLENYYKKTETYTQTEINNLISAISTLDLQVVQTLPTEDISTTTIYLVPKTTAETNDVYDEYIYVSNAWEHIGSTEVDLTNYVKNTDYAGSNKVGVIRTNPDYGTSITSVGALISATKTYQQYQDTTTQNMFISKGTLENVIAGKGLVSNTDYASNNTGGVVKTNTNYGISVDSNGSLRGTTKTYEDYGSMHNLGLISKITLENVIEGKGLVSNDDLTNYVTNTDYATSSTGGVIRTGASYGTTMASAGTLRAVVKTYEDYSSAGNYMFVGKGTLENVIAGKKLDLKQLSTFDSTKTQVLKNINGTLTWVDE